MGDPVKSCFFTLFPDDSTASYPIEDPRDLQDKTQTPFPSPQTTPKKAIVPNYLLKKAQELHTTDKKNFTLAHHSIKISEQMRDKRQEKYFSNSFDNQKKT